MQTQVLSGGVGNSQPNVAEDVSYIQQLLNLSSPATTYAVDTDGVYGQQTASAIKAYQMILLKSSAPDGIVSPGGPTLASMESAINTPPGAAPALLQSQAVPSGVLTQEDYQAAADQLQCDVATIQAVAQVETSGSPYDPQGRPTILFERHVFSRYTDGVWDALHPDLSNPVQGGYGLLSLQYARIIEAATLADDGSTLHAALLAASWGMFQVMGFNAEMVGFASVEDCITQMRGSIAAHLKGFVGYIQATPNALSGIRTKNWNQFAAAYNGSGNVGVYSQKTQAAYNAIVSGG